MATSVVPRSNSRKVSRNIVVYLRLLACLVIRRTSRWRRDPGGFVYKPAPVQKVQGYTNRKRFRISTPSTSLAPGRAEQFRKIFRGWPESLPGFGREAQSDR